MDRSSLPRLRVGVDAPSAVHAVLRGMVKERGNLTLGMQDYLRYVSSETDMTHGAILAAVLGLESRGLLERDPRTGGIVLVCMAMEALGALRLGAQAKSPGFSWDEACSCCAIRGMNEGEVWASIGRLMVSGYLHAGPDFAFLRLCPSPDDEDSVELRQALSGGRLGDRSTAGA